METIAPTFNPHTRTAPVLQGLYTYRLQALPDDMARRAIAFEHAHLREQYGHDIPLVPPSIQLMEFMAREEMESTIIRWMHRIISTQHSFLVQFQGYGALSSRRLYLRLNDQQPFLQMTRSMQVIDQYIRNYDCPPAKPNMHLCLPVTGILSEPLFERLTLEYAQRKTRFSLEVRELSLLRLEHALDPGTPINRFGLQTL